MLSEEETRTLMKTRLFNTLQEAKDYALKEDLKKVYIKKYKDKFYIQTEEEYVLIKKRNDFLNEALGYCYGQE